MTHFDFLNSALIKRETTESRFKQQHNKNTVRLAKGASDSDTVLLYSLPIHRRILCSTGGSPRLAYRRDNREDSDDGPCQSVCQHSFSCLLLSSPSSFRCGDVGNVVQIQCRVALRNSLRVIYTRRSKQAPPVSPKIQKR